VLVAQAVVLQALVQHQDLLAVQELLVKAMLAVIVLMDPLAHIKAVVEEVQVLLEMAVLVLHQELELVVLVYQMY
jgi:hypothetical protein